MKEVTSLSEAELKAVLRAVLAGQTVVDALNVFGINYDRFSECEANEQVLDVLEKAEAYLENNFIAREYLCTHASWIGRTANPDLTHALIKRYRSWDSEH